MKDVFLRKIPEDCRFGGRATYGANDQTVSKGRTYCGWRRKRSGQGRDATLLHILMDRVQ